VLSKVWPQTRSINVIWVLVRNANYWAHPRLSESETIGMGPAICVLTDLLADFEVH